MFNTPWRFRKQTGFVSSKGPNFNWSPRYTCSLSGTKLSIKMPKNRYVSKWLEVVKLPSYYNVAEGYQMGAWTDRSYPISTYQLIRCAYHFYGDNFTGIIGTIYFYGILIKSLKITEGLNFFHPRAMENFIVSKMTDDFGDDFSLDGKAQVWNGPNNWQPQAGRGTPAVRFEMQADPRFEEAIFNSYLFFPVSKHHLVELGCKVVRHRSPLQIRDRFPIDEWNAPKPYRELIDQIYNSVQVTLSPEAEAQRQEAIVGLQDASLVKEFPPFYWQKKSNHEKKRLV